MNATDTDGRVLNWTHMGLPQAMFTPGLPYFFASDDDDLRLGAVAPRHANEPAGVGRAYVETEAATFALWVGDAELPITVTSGDRGLTAIDIEMADGTTITVGPPHPHGSSPTTGNPRRRALRELCCTLGQLAGTSLTGTPR